MFTRVSRVEVVIRQSSVRIDRLDPFDFFGHGSPRHIVRVCTNTMDGDSTDEFDTGGFSERINVCYLL